MFDKFLLRHIWRTAYQPHWRYLKYVLRHKWFVFWACFYYGLYWRGIKHDWSKFTPREWYPYVRFFYGDGAGSSETGVQSNRRGYYHEAGKPENIAFDIAWNYHQKANDHHWQFWLLNRDNGDVLPLPMPDVCRKEMLADWRGAGMAQGKPNTWEWYEANKDKMQLHPDTRAWVEKELAKWKDMHRVGVMLGFEHDV